MPVWTGVSSSMSRGVVALTLAIAAAACSGPTPTAPTAASALSAPVAATGGSPAPARVSYQAITTDWACMTAPGKPGCPGSAASPTTAVAGASSLSAPANFRATIAGSTVTLL